MFHKSNKPSKKVIIFLIVALLALAWLFLITNDSIQRGDLVFDYSDEKSGATKFLKGGEDDFDDDGLIDWEESLWKTDINDPDTDRDGTLDGDEVRMGRNPTVAGPDDVWVSLPPVENIFLAIPEGETKTSLLSKQLIANYLVSKQPGEDVADSTKGVIVDQFASGFKEIADKDKYTFFDIKISKAPSTNNLLRTYGNEAGEIIQKYLYNKLPDEAEIITVIGITKKYKNESEALDALNNLTEEKMSSLIGEGNKELANSLNIFIEAYRKTIDDLLKLEVPADVSGLHLDLINRFNNVMVADENMMKVFDDPLAGIAGIKLYASEASRVFNAWQSLSNYFSDKEVVFGKSEGGHVFISLLESLNI